MTSYQWTSEWSTVTDNFNIAPMSPLGRPPHKLRKKHRGLSQAAPAMRQRCSEETGPPGKHGARRVIMIYHDHGRWNTNHSDINGNSTSLEAYVRAHWWGDGPKIWYFMVLAMGLTRFITPIAVVCCVLCHYQMATWMKRMKIFLRDAFNFKTTPSDNKGLARSSKKEKHL